MLVHDGAGVRGRVRKGAHPLDGLPKIMALENTWETEVIGLG